MTDLESMKKMLDAAGIKYEEDRVQNDDFFTVLSIAGDADWGLHGAWSYLVFDRGGTFHAVGGSGD